MVDKAAIETDIGRRIKRMHELNDAAVSQHNGFMPGEDVKEWNDHAEKLKELKAQVKRMNDVAGLMPDLGGPADVDVPSKPFYEIDRAKGQTLGDVIMGSREYADLKKQWVATGGVAGKNQRVNSEPIRVRTEHGKKDFVVTGSSSTSAGALVWPQFDGLSPYWSSYQRPLVVRQLFTQATTETDTIEYTRITSVTNNAAMRAEATSEDMPTVPSIASTPYGGGNLVNSANGGYAAESGMVFERDTVLVQDIAHWMPVTKRALADAGQIQAQIDIFLGYGIEASIETQLISGNGTAPNLTGFTAVSGVQSLNQAALPNSLPNDPFIALRRGVTNIRINAHCEPTAILMHPQDWEGIDLQRAGVYTGGSSGSFLGAGSFIGDGPFRMTAPSLWGKPVVQSEAVAPGNAYLAAWNRAVVYDRQQASVQMTDQHADFFIRGLVAILAEERLSFAVLHPQAFLEISNFDTTRSVGSAAGVY